MSAHAERQRRVAVAGGGEEHSPGHAGGEAPTNYHLTELKNVRE